MKISICILLLIIVTAPTLHANYIAILTIAYESSGEPYEGQKMVASVIRQRMIERNQSAENVCLDPDQFSCWSYGKPTQERDIAPEEYHRASRAWAEAQAEGYNHYHADYANPYWAKYSINKIQVGKHIFHTL